MDFGNKTRSKRRKHGNKENIPEIYNHNLQFYKMPPVDTISLFEFEDYAVERLRGMQFVGGVRGKESDISVEKPGRKVPPKVGIEPTTPGPLVGAL